MKTKTTQVLSHLGLMTMGGYFTLTTYGVITEDYKAFQASFVCMGIATIIFTILIIINWQLVKKKFLERLWHE